MAIERVEHLGYFGHMFRDAEDGRWYGVIPDRDLTFSGLTYGQAEADFRLRVEMLLRPEER